MKYLISIVVEKLVAMIPSVVASIGKSLAEYLKKQKRIKKNKEVVARIRANNDRDERIRDLNELP